MSSERIAAAERRRRVKAEDVLAGRQGQGEGQGPERQGQRQGAEGQARLQRLAQGRRFACATVPGLLRRVLQVGPQEGRLLPQPEQEGRCRRERQDDSCAS